MIRRLDIASEVPEEDRALARTLSASPVIGDPDLTTLSSVEVERAWSHLDQVDARDVAGLVRLSRLLGVAVPEHHETSGATSILGPPRFDADTGELSRRTRIVCTLGPASDDVDTLAEMIRAGMDVARLNFSHITTLEDARRFMETLDRAMDAAGRPVVILADLRGPKIRVGQLDEPVTLVTDATVHLGPEGLPVTPPEIVAELEPADRVFIDDGKLQLEITAAGPTARARVIRGGTVRSRKGINLPDTQLSLQVPTDKDIADIATIEALGIGLVAVSFVEDGADLERVRGHFTAPVKLMAKIERARAVTNLDAIMEAADGIMVARGDGAVEIGEAQMPVVQRQIHHLGTRLQVPTGTATEMLASMTEGGGPTRAEASDVARAALEGSDFVMTSGETAVGVNPVHVIRTMSKILEATEGALRSGAVSS